MSDAAPKPLQDWGVGAMPVPGQPALVAEHVVRLTAPNPSMMSGPGTNSYLVGCRELVIIDPGPDIVEHRQALLDAVDGRVVSAVVVTHTHPDHAPGAKLLAKVLDAPCAGFGPGPKFEPDLLLREGSLLGEAEARLRTVHTPGHASNHLCFLMESQGLLFSGDHIMEGSTVVIQPPDGDLVAYLESLRLLGAMEPPLRAVAPGHGRMIEDPLGVIKDIVQHRRARHDVVKAALAEAGRSDAEGLVDAVYPELGPERRQVATGTLWAHLRALVVEGEAQLEGALPGEEEIFASFSAARSA